MLWYWLTLVSAVVAVVCAEAPSIDSTSWQNIRYYRTFDLSHPYIKENILVEIKNTSPNPQSWYFLPLNDATGEINAVSQFSASVVGNKDKLASVETDKGVYAVQLPYPIAPDSSIELSAFFVYTDPISPLPKKVSLEDRQHLLLRLNKFCYSPYSTDEYSLSFHGLGKGQEMQVPSDTKSTPGLPELKGRVETDSKSVTFGPVQAPIPPYAVAPMGLLYDHQRPLTHATTLVRSFWLPGSDIDIVQTEEYYELTNKAAELKTGFSRRDWMKGRFDFLSEHFALSRLDFAIDKNAPFNELYYSDKVGMVSSHQKTPNHVVLQPRFPLFGGWKYNFTISWSNDLETFVRKVKGEDDTYVAQFSLLNSLRDIHYDNVEINFLLPENAEFISASSAIPADEIVVGSELSYLDVSDGHVKVSLKFKNLYDELSTTKVLVKYKYSRVSFWHKVAKIAAFMFTGLMSYYALGLIDISINK